MNDKPKGPRAGANVNLGLELKHPPLVIRDPKTNGVRRRIGKGYILDGLYLPNWILRELCGDEAEYVRLLEQKSDLLNRIHKAFVTSPGRTRKEKALAACDAAGWTFEEGAHDFDVEATYRKWTGQETQRTRRVTLCWEAIKTIAERTGAPSEESIREQLSRAARGRFYVPQHRDRYQRKSVSRVDRD